MTLDATTFVAEAKAKLDRLTGNARPIEVGDRVRYSDTPKTRSTGLVGVHAGAVTAISEPYEDGRRMVEYTDINGYTGRDFNSFLEVLPWVEWPGGSVPDIDMTQDVEFVRGDGSTYICIGREIVAERWMHTGPRTYCVMKFRVLLQKS